MGLSWQQGPLAPAPAGRFLVPDPLPERLLYAEPLRRRSLVGSDGPRFNVCGSYLFAGCCLDAGLWPRTGGS